MTINRTTVFTTRHTVFSHVTISSGSTLTVKNILNLIGRVMLTVNTGGQLVIDGGVITNAAVVLEAGAKLVIKNNGKLIMRTGNDFNAPNGAIVDITQGGIFRSHDF